MKKKIVLTENQLEDICARFFDTGYFKGMYQQSNKDRSIEIFDKRRDEIFPEILKKFKLK